MDPRDMDASKLKLGNNIKDSIYHSFLSHKLNKFFYMNDPVNEVTGQAFILTLLQVCEMDP